MRRGNLADFEATNMILASGEPCYVIDDNRFVIGDGQTAFLDLPILSSEVAERVKLNVKNESGNTITKGTPVYITGTVGASETISIGVADASDASTMPAVGLLETDLINNGVGHVVVGGMLKNIQTDPIDGITPTESNVLYVKVGGGLTTNKPTGVSNLIQNVGKVGKVSGGNSGSIIVSSIMRTNDVPNHVICEQITVGDYSLPTSDGSANQLLQTDGSGQLSFVSPTAASVSFQSDTIAVGSGSYSNWTPSVTADTLSLTTTGDLTLNSLVSTYGSGKVKIYNVGSHNLYITHNVGASDNSILTSNDEKLNIEPQAGVELTYDSSSSRWRAYKIPNPVGSFVKYEYYTTLGSVGGSNAVLGISSDGGSYNYDLATLVGYDGGLEPRISIDQTNGEISGFVENGVYRFDGSFIYRRDSANGTVDSDFNLIMEYKSGSGSYRIMDEYYEPLFKASTLNSSLYYFTAKLNGVMKFTGSDPTQRIIRISQSPDITSNIYPDYGYFTITRVG